MVEGWNWLIIKVPSNPNHSLILCSTDIPMTLSSCWGQQYEMILNGLMHCGGLMLFCNSFSFSTWVTDFCTTVNSSLTNVAALM